MRLKYVELVSSILFVLHLLGRALLALSGCLITAEGVLPIPCVAGVPPPNY
jgi:hypothetical protein